MPIPHSIKLSIQRFLTESVLRIERWLLADDEGKNDPLLGRQTVPSPSSRALDYDAYMRNNRVAKTASLEFHL